MVPPNADKVLLMEDRSIGTEEVVRFVVGTYVEGLALSFYVRIVTRVLLIFTTE